MSVNIDISLLRINGGTQSRAEINREVVSDYAELVKAGTEFPPVVVFHDGSAYWLADGFHRYEAYAQAGMNELPAELRQGTQRDAVLFSVGANASHGLRRTNDDKRRAVMVLLNDPEWSGWSDREIARQCGVSPSFVGGLRGLSVHNGQIETARTVTRNGATYQQNTANIGGAQKARKAEQKPTTATPAEPSEVVTNADDSEPAPEPVAPADDDAPAGEAPDADDDEIDAEARREYRSLTKDGREDVWVEKCRIIVELHDELSAAKQERDALKATLADMQCDDKDRLIRKLNEELSAAKYRRDQAMGDCKVEEAKRKRAEREKAALQKRVDELQNMEIAL